MLTDAIRHAIAQSLLAADFGRHIIPQPSKTHPGMDLDDAYAVQRLWAEGRIARGARIIGHKIGLTSRAMQKASNITEPDYGVMLDDAAFTSGAVIEESGVSAAVMGHPAEGIAWLVRKLAGVGGGLQKGEIVLAGSFTRPIDIRPGDVISADFGPLGSLGLAFAA